ncbi:hypothetical protein MicloDRAFT_00024640 [Microvirga lotononidis]|uniref:Uncharacterized protein n=1 Tax=Microvirga lotononidis TaxID=864069 RepID=I4YXX8_9HYPH|nr:hypothetical protein MicloDRAFT_00024640 [Microvirga lotononidis]
MNVARPISFLGAGARAALALTALAGAADFATGLAFSRSAIQKRVDDVMRHAPNLASPDEGVK